ncbi:MAG: helix-hairpin-helix domain-containing protein [Bacteroidota bacterium]|jgi:hypothetical protein|nr:helix-hairpin-helix domain-containing protein [Bacteroidota bacterium]HHU97663.1 helix-hairpin-helix domain-containing protein [Petrimonas sp.]
MKRYLFPFLVVFLCNFSVGLQAQEREWRVLVEQMAEEEGARVDAIENLYEELLYLERHPMDLNRVSRDQLERFPLLSSEQVLSLLEFLEENRPLYTVYELRNVPRLDHRTVELILPFFRVDEAEGVRVQDWAQVREQDRVWGQDRAWEKPLDFLKKARHEVQGRFDKTLTERAGYRALPDSLLERYPNRKYLGEDFYTSFRYSLSYYNKLQVGFTAEKDAGEPFFVKGYRKGYDHHGVHLVLRDVGKLRTVALGDYRLSFGQGLVLNNDFMGSKAWGTDNIARRTQQPKRHFSTAESGFFRGAAVATQLGDFSLTAFYSSRWIDTNLNDQGEITSLKVDGLHRTPLEMEKRKNTWEQVGGANITYRHGRFQAGLSGIYYRYNRDFNPVMRPYNRYYLRGSDNWNAGVDYSYQLPGFIFAGETAIARNGSVATINMVQYRPSVSFNLSLLHRYYPISYNALHAHAFSEGSRVQNERGFYVGVGSQLLPKFNVTAYIDLIRFPWVLYGVDTPSKAVDFYLLGSYSFTRSKFLEARYKLKRKEKNRAVPDVSARSVIPYTTNKLRLRYSHGQGDGWSFRTTADMAAYSEKNSSAEFGYMISQSVSYRGKAPLTGDVYLAWFDADSYNARLYSYERNLLSTFYMPSFYGKGIRFALSAKYQLLPGLALSVKLGHTRYFNRDTIGSGTELIDGNRRTDLFTYLVWKF